MLSKHSFLLSKHFSAKSSAPNSLAKFPSTSVRPSIKLFASCAAKITRMSKHGIPRFPESCLKITCKKYNLIYRYYRHLDRLYYSDDIKQCCFASDCQNIRSSSRFYVFSSLFIIISFEVFFAAIVLDLKNSHPVLHPLLEIIFHFLSNF